MVKFALLILLAVPMISAAPVPNRLVEYGSDVSPEDAKAALLAQGFAVKDVVVAGGKNVIALAPSESRDPLPVISALPTRSDKAAVISRLKVLAAKGAKNLTPDEVNEVLDILMSQVK